MSDEARRKLKALREEIGKNDTALRLARRKHLENEVALKIIKVVKLAIALRVSTDIQTVFDEIDKQSVQIVNYLRENL